jgi:outer membrane protein TolC
MALAIVVGLGTWSITAAAEPDVYELEEILDRARQFGPLQAEHQARQEHARWQQYRADRAFWPRIEAQTLLAPVPADADPSRIGENLDEIRALNIGPFLRQTARVTVPLYTFGRISAARELAAIGVDVSELQADAAVQDHLLSTRQAYYGRQLARAFEELIAEGGGLVKETLEQMEEDRAFGEGDFSTEDLRRLQIFDAELDTMILDNRRLADLTEAALRYLADLDGPVPVPPLTTEHAEVEIEELETYQELARHHRPEVRQLELAIEARRADEGLQRAEFFPNLFLAVDFGFGWSNKDPALQRVCRRVDEDGPCVDSETLFARPYANPFDSLTFGVAVGLQWRLDFAQQYGRLQASRALLSQTQAQEERALGALRLEVEQAWRTAADARERVEIETRRFDAARRWRNQYGLQTQLGRGDLKDAIDPLRAYYQARVAQLEATFLYLNARAELARAVGLETIDGLE